MFYLLHKGDALAYHAGPKFSTQDRDNGRYSGSCAVKAKGGWWYKGEFCYRCNLNGLYYHRGSYRSSNISTDPDGVVWYNWKHAFSYSMKFTEMKIRPFY